MKQSLCIIIFIGLMFLSCGKHKSGSNEKIIEDYYQVFNERQEFERFLDFYDENIILEDIINGDRIIGKQNLKNFFDWSNPNFICLKENSLVIVEKIVSENKSVIKGFFTEFKWGDLKFDPMHFTTILTFNKFGKIIKQVDWVNYPSTLVDYKKRKNSNDWIN